MRIEIGQIFTQIVSFLVMLWVLKKYAWKPLLAILEKRQNTIKGEFADIENQKTELDKLAEEYRQKLKGIDELASVKTKEAIDQGRQMAMEIQNEAHQQAKGIIAKAKEDLQKEVLKAKVQLKDELVNMTVMAAEKILQKNLDKEKQKNLMMDFIDQMESQ